MAQLTACPICAHERLPDDFSRELVDGRVLRWARCRRCGFTFMNPRIDQAEMLKLYSSPAYWHDGAYADYIDGEAVRVRNSRVRMARVAKYLPSRGHWLDIGCATGSFSCVAKDYGYTVVGIDPAGEMVRFGRERHGLDLRAMTIEEFDGDASSFDVVSFWGTDRISTTCGAHSARS